jgi:hypothetical protein
MNSAISSRNTSRTQTEPSSVRGGTDDRSPGFRRRNRALDQLLRALG